MQKNTIFAIGQRWLSDSEPELGLGIVADLDHRTVTVSFRSCDQTRCYAKDQAPLNRIAFSAGDTITACTGEQLVVIEAIEFNDTLVYHAHGLEDKDDLIKLPESLLSDTLVLNKPSERLFTGQIDNASWFYLRKQTIEHLSLIERSKVLGLCSARTDLIPHQLYIAAEVAKRYAPRVMLADEVGLGKTIEAGLILQQQLANGLASRVLIIVPEPLLHQWLVEMLRRFNLQFSLFSEERCRETMQAMIENEDTQHNPLMDEQLVLTSVDVFQKQPEWFDYAIAGEWDLCIVDEAHHLRDDSEGHAEGTESEKHNDYTRVKRIADSSKGVLLLTATPEQMGRKNHFALLQLLDPNRFTQYEAYQQEHAHYTELAETINALIDGDELSPAQLKDLSKLLVSRHSPESVAEMTASLNDKASSEEQRQESADQLVRMLLDQHGTGRILFRNTRRSLTGFPERHLNVYELEQPPQYQELQSAMPDSLDAHLKPESIYISELTKREDDEANNAPQWTSFDARVKWLLQFLKQHKDEKILLICAQDVSAINLERYLRVNEGVRSSVFHRHMNIIDRDRAAAYFASNEDSAQILICSEIGSEGRNFQFCRHLILFDLPLNPDLLEQRIGRLDRIGQKNTIELHVPVFKDSAQEKLVHWYQDALNAFEHVSPAAYRVYRQFQQELEQVILSHSKEDNFQDLLERAKELNSQLNKELENGRDRLLEINSFNRPKAEKTIAKIEAFEAANTPEQYLRDCFDTYGIHYEQNSDESYILKAGEDMIVSEFPALPDEGLTATFNRGLSLHREDIQFLTWQHPMVRSLMDMTLDSPQGGAALSIYAQGKLDEPVLRDHSLVLETVYRIVAPAPKELQLPKFLKQNHFHFAMVKDKQDERVDPAELKLALDNMRPTLKSIDKANAAELVSEFNNEITELLSRANKLAEHRMAKSVETAATKMLQIQTNEIKRLVALKKVNPNVRDSELNFLKEQTMQLHQCLKQASVELVAVHVLVRAD
ncbi:MAG: RNA polymerase-associated protein RapA [Pseudohongiellaceae bacterium]|nr:RNA polymerase-associated protein RapA [Pseudohongiellaceae bacterium]